MSRVRSRDTDIELLLRRALWRRGVRYRLHARLPGTPDLVVTGARTAVFVDACFWHGCPDHYRAPVTNADYWREKIDRNRQRDGRVDSELEDAGWTVIRLWEHELRVDLDAAVDRVVRAVRA